MKRSSFKKQMMLFMLIPLIIMFLVQIGFSVSLGRHNEQLTNAYYQSRVDAIARIINQNTTSLLRHSESLGFSANINEFIFLADTAHKLPIMPDVNELVSSITRYNDLITHIFITNNIHTYSLHVGFHYGTQVSGLHNIFYHYSQLHEGRRLPAFFINSTDFMRPVLVHVRPIASTGSIVVMLFDLQRLLRVAEMGQEGSFLLVDSFGYGMVFQEGQLSPWHTIYAASSRVYSTDFSSGISVYGIGTTGFQDETMRIISTFIILSIVTSVAFLMFASFLWNRNIKMTRRIITTQAKLYETEMMKQKSEISALHSQINPHFLYNTLACIKGLAHINSVKVIADLCSAISSIMRYSIKCHEKVALRDELKIMEQYLLILRTRFPGRFLVKTDIPEELMDRYIIKMSLQPLVENAVYHGFENVESGGEIHVFAREEDGNLVVTICDNGEGIPPPKLAALNDTLSKGGMLYTFEAEGEAKGIGLFNIDRRIKMIFGKDYGLNIQSSETGTCIILRLPS